ncbi:hypothetical protein ACH4E7_40305 [Kitasatospora sp. NPDC018058]|uniref:hypothetical protein n=1 Tax=Kitasatospora sp. NPDC018058 TaxID=3364025 RepID=UPI0037BE9E4F
MTARDPHHLRAHEGALQYWCAKWHGSHELMHTFVDAALADAPAGSLLTTLRVRATPAARAVSMKASMAAGWG